MRFKETETINSQRTALKQIKKLIIFVHLFTYGNILNNFIQFETKLLKLTYL